MLNAQCGGGSHGESTVGASRSFLPLAIICHVAHGSAVSKKSFLPTKLQKITHFLAIFKENAELFNDCGIRATIATCRQKRYAYSCQLKT